MRHRLTVFWAALVLIGLLTGLLLAAGGSFRPSRPEGRASFGDLKSTPGSSEPGVPLSSSEEPLQTGADGVFLIAADDEVGRRPERRVGIGHRHACLLYTSQQRPKMGKTGLDVFFR